MWSKRPLKNRRLGREYVLDVKLRSSQVHARRVRLAAMALGGIFAAVAGLYLAWRASECALDVLLYDNKAFALHQIDVQTDGVIALDQLRRWSGVRLGQNLFALDLAEVKRNLELVSMIQSVSLEKVLPHTLRLRVTEREPLAQLNIARPKAGGGFELAQFYLDGDAYVVLPLSSSQCSPSSINLASDQLPLISGVNPIEVQPGRRLDSPQVRAALELLLAFQRSPMQGLADIKKVDVSNPEVLVVKTAQGGEITFGLKQPDQQLLRWQSVSQAGQRMNKAIATLDLAVSNSIPATWTDTNGVPQVSAKLSKPLRNKKKHV
jgi:cell division septal protein FtsQ